MLDREANAKTPLEGGLFYGGEMRKLILSLLLIFLSLQGCASMHDVIQAKQSGSEGTTVVYEVNKEQAWDISKTVFRWEGCDAIEEHKDQNYMLTSSGMNMVSWGTVMGAWVDPVDAVHTQVTVVTKRRVTINIATTLTEGTFHNRFAQAVEIIKLGKTLPSLAPPSKQKDSP